MAEKKMTQVQALEIAIAEIENEEARGILAGMLEKKRAPRKPRVNKAAIEFAEKVAAFMEGFENPLTNAEIAAGLSNGAEKGEDGYVSFQKVAAAIRRLEGEGRVERIKGEKAKDKDTFILA